MITLVRRARRRLLCNELLTQGANASSAALAAFILLLLLGTQILDWRWVVLVPMAAAAGGVWLVLRRRPSAYRVAQIVDGRMGLADTISTALFFAQTDPGNSSAEAREFQRQQAERLAPGVDVRAAIPFTMPRAVYALAVLALVASSLFALRYGLTRRLDLKPPLARILRQTLGPDQQTEMAKTRRNRRPDPQSMDDDDEAIEKEIAAAEAKAERASQDANQTPIDKAEGKQANNAAAKAPEEGPKAETQDPEEGEQQAAGQNPSEGKQGNGKSDQQSAGRQDSQNSTENSSLLSKMKDAVQNLLSRVKPQEGGAGSQQQSATSQSGRQGKSQQNSGKQQASRDGKQQSGGQQSDSQEAQAGQEAQNAQDPQGKGTGTSDAQQTSKQPGSGIGSQNGDKNIKQAEQLAAMGKLSQIFGKRSATITGQATVEVQSTSQQLQTPYANRSAEHSQTGAEISRDEIPAALQGYVEQYFEQVRKPAAKK